MKKEITFEQVSKEVRTKISKIGTASLSKKYQNGEFEGEELAAAKHYLEKRGVLSEQSTEETEMYTEEEKAQLMKTGKHVSKMTEEEKAKAFAELDARKAKNQEKIEAEKTAEQPKEEKKPKTTATEKKAKSAKVEEDPMIKLTAQEFQLFEEIKRRAKDKGKSFAQDVLHENGEYASLREFKGILSSLRKKDIIEYEGDQPVKLTTLGSDMVKGKMQYKEKAKNERNFFKKERLMKEINGKSMDKSAYVRSLLRKNKNITYGELKEALNAAGFPKLYHSELQRCREQLGIQTVKSED